MEQKMESKTITYDKLREMLKINKTESKSIVITGY